MHPKGDHHPHAPPSVQTKATARPVAVMGTGLFASTKVQACEDVIFSKSPFVAVVETPQLGDTCSGCFGRRQLLEEAGGENHHGVELKRCVGCRVVKYCDKVYIYMIFSTVKDEF